MIRTPDARAASADVIAGAGAVLRAGGLVAFPTETVYGLGADAGNDKAVAAVFEVKRRPAFKPLTVLVADLDAARRLAHFDRLAIKLANEFWPGPLTLVLPRRPDCAASALVSAGLDSIALRSPDHPIAQALLRAAGVAVVATSANISGRTSPTEVDQLGPELRSAVALVIDGGPCLLGIESTVLAPAPDGVRLLRPGALAGGRIEALLGVPLILSAPGGRETGG